MELKSVLTVTLYLIYAACADHVTYKKVCYYTNWSQYRHGAAKFLPEDIDPFLCTHVIFAFAKLAGNRIVAREWNDETVPWKKGLYENVTDLKKVNPKLKVLLSIGGWNAGGKPFSDMAATAASRREFATSTVTFLRKRHFDGVDIDWEFPGNIKSGGAPKDKNNLSLLLKVVSTVFKKEVRAPARDRLMLSIAVPASQEKIDDGYKVSDVSLYCDMINVMTYNYHGSWDVNTGHNSPLFKRNVDTTEYQSKLNVEWTMNYWIRQGAQARKLILGFPMYGRGFTLADSNKKALGDPAKGGSVSGSFTNDVGFLAYYEICKMLKSGATVTWDDVQKVPHLVLGDQWIGFDNERSIKEKVKWLKKYTLGGIMVWALPLDDFKGQHCGEGQGETYPLLRSIISELNKPDTATNQLTISSDTTTPVTPNRVSPDIVQSETAVKTDTMQGVPLVRTSSSKTKSLLENAKDQSGPVIKAMEVQSNALAGTDVSPGKTDTKTTTVNNDPKKDVFSDVIINPDKVIATKVVPSEGTQLLKSTSMHKEPLIKVGSGKLEKHAKNLKADGKAQSGPIGQAATGQVEPLVKSTTAIDVKAPVMKDTVLSDSLTRTGRGKGDIIGKVKVLNELKSTLANRKAVSNAQQTKSTIKDAGHTDPLVKTVAKASPIILKNDNKKIVGTKSEKNVTDAKTSVQTKSETIIQNTGNLGSRLSSAIITKGTASKKIGSSVFKGGPPVYSAPNLNDLQLTSSHVKAALLTGKQKPITNLKDKSQTLPIVQKETSAIIVSSATPTKDPSNILHNHPGTESTIQTNSGTTAVTPSKPQSGKQNTKQIISGTGKENVKDLSVINEKPSVNAEKNSKFTSRKLLQMTDTSAPGLPDGMTGGGLGGMIDSLFGMMSGFTRGGNSRRRGQEPRGSSVTDAPSSFNTGTNDIRSDNSLSPRQTQRFRNERRERPSNSRDRPVTAINNRDGSINSIDRPRNTRDRSLARSGRERSNVAVDRASNIRNRSNQLSSDTLTNVSPLPPTTNPFDIIDIRDPRGSSVTDNTSSFNTGSNGIRSDNRLFRQRQRFRNERRERPPSSRDRPVAAINNRDSSINSIDRPRNTRDRSLARSGRERSSIAVDRASNIRNRSNQLTIDTITDVSPLLPATNPFDTIDIRNPRDRGGRSSLPRSELNLGLQERLRGRPVDDTRTARERVLDAIILAEQLPDPRPVDSQNAIRSMARDQLRNEAELLLTRDQLGINDPFQRDILQAQIRDPALIRSREPGLMETLRRRISNTGGSRGNSGIATNTRTTERGRGRVQTDTRQNNGGRFQSSDANVLSRNSNLRRNIAVDSFNNRNRMADTQRSAARPRTVIGLQRSGTDRQNTVDGTQRTALDIQSSGVSGISGNDRQRSVIGIQGPGRARQRNAVGVQNGGPNRRRTAIGVQSTATDSRTSTGPQNTGASRQRTLVAVQGLGNDRQRTAVGVQNTDRQRSVVNGQNAGSDRQRSTIGISPQSGQNGRGSRQRSAIGVQGQSNDRQRTAAGVNNGDRQRTVIGVQRLGNERQRSAVGIQGSVANRQRPSIGVQNIDRQRTAIGVQRSGNDRPRTSVGDQSSTNDRQRGAVGVNNADPQRTAIGVQRSGNERQRTAIGIQGSVTDRKNPPIGIQNIDTQRTAIGVQRSGNDRQRTSVGDQSSTSDRQRTTIGVQNADRQRTVIGGVQRSGNDRQRTSVGIQGSVPDRQRPSVSVTNIDRQRTAIGVQRAGNDRQRTSVGVQSSTSDRQRTAIGVSNVDRQRTAIGVQRSGNERQRTAVGIQGSVTDRQNPSTGVQNIDRQRIAIGVQRSGNDRQRTPIGVQGSTNDRRRMTAGVQSADRQRTAIGVQRSGNDRQRAPVVNQNPVISRQRTAIGIQSSGDIRQGSGINAGTTATNSRRTVATNSVNGIITDLQFPTVRQQNNDLRTIALNTILNNQVGSPNTITGSTGPESNRIIGIAESLASQGPGTTPGALISQTQNRNAMEYQIEELLAQINAQQLSTTIEKTRPTVSITPADPLFDTSIRVVPLNNVDNSLLNSLSHGPPIQILNETERHPLPIAVTSHVNSIEGSNTMDLINSLAANRMSMPDSPMATSLTAENILAAMAAAQPSPATDVINEPILLEIQPQILPTEPPFSKDITDALMQLLRDNLLNQNTPPPPQTTPAPFIQEAMQTPNQVLVSTGEQPKDFPPIPPSPRTSILATNATVIANNKPQEGLTKADVLWKWEA